MRSNLDSVLVDTDCPTCGAHIRAPYIQIRSIGIFACGCGTVINADMTSVTAQAALALSNNLETEGTI